MNTSPYSAPIGDFYYGERLSPTATPSPRGPHGATGFYYPSGAATPARPATRAAYGHSRNSSSTAFEFSSTSRPSPRFTSNGVYATANGGLAFVDARDASAAYDTAPPRPRDTAATPRPQQTRRTSASIPTRPQTARPASAHGKKSSSSAAAAATAASASTASSTKVAKATEADAKKHRIPSGYSLKNWDPTESPILLLGSVFDANSLGKWIYDWTVYAQGPTHPISEIAGDLWLLLIQLAGKIRRAEDVISKIRTQDNKDTIVEFLESGERLMDKLRKLLKTCEEPMLKSAKKSTQLGKNAGIEFVETLFGRDRVLDKTEKFMQGVRTFNLRFDANCDDIIKNPTM